MLLEGSELFEPASFGAAEHDIQRHLDRKHSFAVVIEIDVIEEVVYEQIFNLLPLLPGLVLVFWQQHPVDLGIVEIESLLAEVFNEFLDYPHLPVHVD